jgi:FixJ family two-component response regulator
MEELVEATGASAFLRKPFSVKELVDVVSSNLNREDNKDSSHYHNI